MRESRQARRTRTAPRSGPVSTTSIASTPPISLPLVFVVLLDVPGVVGARFVDEGPELVATTGERIPIANRLVDDVVERAVLADLDAQELVFENGPPDQSLHPDSGRTGCAAERGAPGVSGQVQPTEPGDGALGIVDEQPLLHRLGWQRLAVGSGDRRLAVLPREQHRERARREGGIGDDQSLTGCEPFPDPPRCASAASRTAVAVRTTPSSSGIVSW